MSKKKHKKKHDTTEPQLSALGRKVTEFTKFDTFPRPRGCTDVECITDEVTANCPITNQPDWYHVSIAYTPDALCLESKTIKLYLHSFRNKGLFCEAFADKIARDVCKALICDVTVTVTQKPRGGVSIKAQSIWRPHMLPEPAKKTKKKSPF